MIFSARKNDGTVLFSNTRIECSLCISGCKEDCRKIVCPVKDEDRRFGVKTHGDKSFFLCSDSRSTKTSKLFKEKIEFLGFLSSPAGKNTRNLDKTTDRKSTRLNSSH